MKKRNFQLISMSLLLFVFTASLVSFTEKTHDFISTKENFGGEGFEIYINNKLVLQQFGKEINTVKTISLPYSSGNDQLAIRYFHCGQVGKSRIVTIKDEQQKILKEWHFNDTKDPGNKMCCSVKDILALPRLKAGKKLNLYYASSELPQGRLLASIVSSSAGNAQP